MFIYDNNKSKDFIKNVFLSVALEYELDKNTLIAYPEKFALVNLIFLQYLD